MRDARRFLGEAIDSVLAEGRRCPELSVELIVVDDGSVDGSPGLARARGGVRVIEAADGAVGTGPAATRNRGLAAASGELVAFVDADDLWTAGRLGAMLAPFAASAAPALVMGQIESFGEPDALARLTPRLRGVHAFPLFGSALCRRELFERVGAIDERLRFGEDIDWFQRVKEAGVPTVLIEPVVLRRRLHGDNMTRGRDHRDFGTLRLVRESLARRRAAAGADAALPALPSLDDLRRERSRAAPS